MPGATIVFGLRRWLAELGLKKGILTTAGGLLRQGDGAVSRGATFAFIAAEKTTYGVRRLTG